MSKTDVWAIRNIAASLDRAVGRARASRIMEGCDSLTASSGKAAVTRCVACAMGRMDESLDAKSRTAVMRECGRECAAHHAAVAEGMRARYEASTGLDSFLAEETRRFGGGARYERRGKTILHVYEPHSYKRPTRCYCGLAKELASSEKLSRTFCECSAGFVEYTWERVLGRAVSVKLLESAVTGSDVCRFEVTPRGKA